MPAFTPKSISAAVYLNCKNKEDTAAVQELLNGIPEKWGGPTAPLPANGTCDATTVAAIKAVQRRYFSFEDGKVDKDGLTLGLLNEANKYKAEVGNPSGWMEVSVSGAVNPINQKTSMRCWAAASAMMLSWYEGTPYTPREAVQQSNDYYLGLYDSNTGLTPSVPDITEYLEYLGMYGADWDLPGNSPQGWRALMGTDPVAVCLRKSWGCHVRVVVGMKGDGTPYGSSVRIADPDGKQVYWECFHKFGRLYNASGALLNGARIWAFG